MRDNMAIKERTKHEFTIDRDAQQQLFGQARIQHEQTQRMQHSFAEKRTMGRNRESSSSSTTGHGVLPRDPSHPKMPELPRIDESPIPPRTEHYPPISERPSMQYNSDSREADAPGNNSNNLVNQGMMHGGVPRVLPNTTIDACPTVTPQVYQNWKREVKIWRTGKIGGKESQPISKMIAALPLNSRMGTLSYLEESEAQPERRKLDVAIQMLDVRYGRTDSEKEWSWMDGFTNFRR